MTSRLGGGNSTTVCLGEVCSLRQESVRPKDRPDARYVGLEHFESGSAWLRGLGAAGEVTSAKSAFRKNDVLYGKLRPYLDKAALADFDGICSTDILVLRPHEILDASYLSHLTHTEAFR